MSGSLARWAVLALLAAESGWAWGDQGHALVARIAAANLRGASAQRIAELLRLDTELKMTEILGASGAASGEQVAAAMARAANWPDQMPGGRGATAPWHYINIALFEDPRRGLETRCPEGNCITQMTMRMIANLKENRMEGSWPPYKQLAFVIHFLGDIHQPLHCATNADAGGNCVRVEGFAGSGQLHAVWDTALARRALGEDPVTALDRELGRRRREWQKFGSIENIAIESFRLARGFVYRRARPAIPVIPTFVEVTSRGCDTQAPSEIRRLRVDGPGSYDNERTRRLVREQLYKAGVRLAAVLNEVFGK